MLVEKSYDLFTKLENPNDPDRCELKVYKNILNGSFCYNVAHLLLLYELSPHNIR